MNKYLTLILSTLILGVTIPLFSQTVKIEGIITDKDTQEPIPFANITANPSLEGTTTDFDGLFSFSSTKKVKSLSISYLGYETKVIDIDGNNLFLTIELSGNNIMIDETVVIAPKGRKIPKDTAAVALQKLVIDNKEFNRPKSYGSFHYIEHNKIEFDFYKLGEKFTKRKLLQPFKVIFDYLDTTETGNSYLPILLQENISEHYYRQEPKAEKNINHAQYMTGVQNVTAGGVVDDIFQSFDLYNNIIIAGGKPFTSPFSKTGLVTYRYYLTDSLVKDGNKFYRLDFSPIVKTGIAFTGYAWIEESSYAIQSIEFKIPKAANLNYINDFYVKQTFDKPDGENWFLSGEEIHISLNIRKKTDKGSLLVKKRMSRDEMAINIAIPDSIFEGEKNIENDSLGTYNKTWWKENRISPLTEPEAGILVMSDSIEKLRIFKTLNWFGNFGSTGFAKAGPVEFGRFYKFISWNEIEGVRPKFGGRTNKDFNENLQLWAYGAYGTRDKQWKYFGSARILLPRENRKWHAMQFVYQKDFTFLGQAYEDQKFSHDNFFLSILRGEPLEKIMLLETFQFKYEKEWVKGVFTDFSLQRTTFFPVQNVFEFEREISPTETDQINSISIFELGQTTHIGIGQNFFENNYQRAALFTRKPIVDISYNVGLRNFAGGEFGYHKLELEYYHRWSNKVGITKYSLNAGKIFGDIPYPLMFLPIGNQGFYRNGNSYELMNEFEFAVDEFASFWLYHHFDGRIFNRIPLIKKLQFRSIFIFKAMIGNVSRTNENLVRFPAEMNPLETWYMETGFGIENILKVIRVDFMWRLTQRDLPTTRNFGVRFSFDIGL